MFRTKGGRHIISKHKRLHKVDSKDEEKIYICIIFQTIKTSEHNSLSTFNWDIKFSEVHQKLRLKLLEISLYVLDLFGNLGI